MVTKVTTPGAAMVEFEAKSRDVMSQLNLDQALEAASQCLRAGQFQRAGAICQAVLTQFPQQPRALHLLAMLARLSGHPAAGLSLIERAIAADANNAEPHHLHGILLRDLKRSAEALAAFGRAIELKSDFAEAYANLGEMLVELDRDEEAAAAYTKAVTIKPDYGLAWNNFGMVLRGLEKFEQAVDAFAHAAALLPRVEQIRANLGNALSDLDRWEEALAEFEKAVALNPNYATGWNNIGLALQELERPESAVTAFRRAIQLQPDLAEAHMNMANALREMDRLAEALSGYDRALALNPRLADAYNNRGVALQDSGKVEDAMRDYDRAMALEPDSAPVHMHLGNAMRVLNRSAEALAAYDRAIALKPNLADAYVNRGIAFHESGRFDEAANDYERALALRPGKGAAHFNYALLLLLRGDWPRGWAEYECRRSWGKFARGARRFTQQRWDGGDIAGKTLLVWSEQGLGDTIHFLRYASLAAERRAKVIVEVQPSIARLAQTVAGVSQVCVDNDPRPPFDVHLPLMSAAYAFGTTLENIPNDIPYLHPRLDDVEHWRNRMNQDGGGFRVGLCWAGNPDYPGDRNRSIALSKFASLWQIPGVKWYSLQKGAGAEQIKEIAPQAELIDHMHDLNDFSDTAALVANLELVISVDTAVAHLAGAIEKPTWLLLPHIPDWRWQLGRPDSPWYPTMRLFRQTKRGDWAGVIDRIAADLNVQAKDL